MTNLGGLIGRAFSHVVIYIVLITGVQFAHAQPLCSTELLNHIRSQGASAVAANLLSAHAKNGRSELDEVVSKVAIGDDEWVKVGTALLKGTDAGNHYSILIALSEALKQHPSAVLINIPDDETLMRVCQDNTIEPSRAEHEAFKVDTAIAVKNIADPRLLERKRQCLEHLRKTR